MFNDHEVSIFNKFCQLYDKISLVRSKYIELDDYRSNNSIDTDSNFEQTISSLESEISLLNSEISSLRYEFGLFDF